MYNTISYRNYVNLNIAKENILATSLVISSLMFPLITHILGLKGALYLPIFFAIAIGSSFISFPRLLALSVLSPTLNMLITGMPRVPIYYFLLVECVALTFFIFVSKQVKINFYVAIILSMILARFSSFILLPFFDTMSIESWFLGLVNGYRGVIVNILFALGSYLIIKKQSI